MPTSLSAFVFSPVLAASMVGTSGIVKSAFICFVPVSYTHLDVYKRQIKKIAVEIGKTPVQVNEAAGFVVNRILIPMINEAAFILSLIHI